MVSMEIGARNTRLGRYLASQHGESICKITQLLLMMDAS
jgi:hypothetical protein